MLTLDYIKKLNNDFANAKSTELKEEERYKFVCGEVREKFNALRLAEKEKYIRALEAIERWQQQECGFASLENARTHRRRLHDEFYSMSKQIAEKINISHELMCQLLEKETGLKWKMRMILAYDKRKFHKGCRGPYQADHAIVYVNEKSPYFDEESENLLGFNYAERGNWLERSNGDLVFDMVDNDSLGNNGYIVYRSCLFADAGVSDNDIWRYEDDSIDINWVDVYFKDETKFGNFYEYRIESLPKFRMPELFEKVIEKYIQSQLEDEGEQK